MAFYCHLPPNKWRKNETIESMTCCTGEAGVGCTGVGVAVGAGAKVGVGDTIFGVAAGRRVALSVCEGAGNAAVGVPGTTGWTTGV